MAYETFFGQDNLAAGFEAAMYGDFSAVIILGGVRRAKRLFNQTGIPSQILREGVPALVPAEARIRAWAAAQGRVYSGIGQGFQRSGGLEEHFDGYQVSPAAFSIGIEKKAKWHTQIASPHCLDDNGRFDLDRKDEIDEFEQGPDDLVIIPGAPDPSIHEVIAGDRRTARVFTMSSPILPAHPIGIEEY